MRTVFKYPLPPGTTEWVLNLPPSAAVVAVGHQGKRPMLWIDLWTEQEPQQRVFAIVGTGQPVPEDGGHVGSFQTDPNGVDFVFHVYETKETTP